MFDLFATTKPLQMYSVLVNGEVNTFGADSRAEAIRTARWFGLIPEGAAFVCRKAGHLPAGAKYSVEHWHGPYRLRPYYGAGVYRV